MTLGLVVVVGALVLVGEVLTVIGDVLGVVGLVVVEVGFVVVVVGFVVVVVGLVVGERVLVGEIVDGATVELILLLSQQSGQVTQNAVAELAGLAPLGPYSIVLED